uniref:Uncharacterized protein n=1 Tax=Arundo donax TaxID=35708 RepID=A0A0A9C0X1_ARUDO
MLHNQTELGNKISRFY